MDSNFKIVEKKETLEWAINGNIEYSNLSKYFIVNMKNFDITCFIDAEIGYLLGSLKNENVLFVMDVSK